MPAPAETTKPKVNWVDVLLIFLFLVLLSVIALMGYEMVRFAHHMIADGRFGEAGGFLRIDFSAPSLAGLGIGFILFLLILLIRRKTRKFRRLNIVALCLSVLLLIMSIIQFSLTTSGFEHLPI